MYIIQYTLSQCICWYYRHTHPHTHMCMRQTCTVTDHSRTRASKNAIIVLITYIDDIDYWSISLMIMWSCYQYNERMSFFISVGHTRAYTHACERCSVNCKLYVHIRCTMFIVHIVEYYLENISLLKDSFFAYYITILNCIHIPCVLIIYLYYIIKINCIHSFIHIRCTQCTLYIPGYITGYILHELLYYSLWYSHDNACAEYS